MRTSVLLAVGSVLVSSAFVIAPAQAQVPAGDRAALVAFYTATGGPGWTRSDGWLGPEGTECTWLGVGCDGGRVVSVELVENQLVGELPGELTALTGLTLLNLGWNDLSGPVPIWLADFPLLSGVVLTHNRLSGPVPRDFSRSTSLQYLILGENQLSGEIPVELAQIGTLVELGLYGNQLTGGIPAELSQLTNLEYLTLGGNQLSGEIPASLGSLSRLQLLDLYGNQLEGPIPNDLAALSELRALSLGGNRLTGLVPTWLGNLTLLEGLGLDSNQLEGTIPVEIGNLVNLLYLDLSANRFTGDLPVGIGNLVHLEGLWAGGNLLSGSIPPELGNLTNLRTLWLGFNQLGGVIPPELGNLGQLEYLGLEGNLLEGPIPAELGNLALVTELWLGANHLDGAIPPELGNLDRLVVLWLAWNRLEGPVPAELGQLTSLVAMDLSSNRLVGELPASLSNLGQLASDGLNLHWNGLYTGDEALRSFVDSHHAGDSFELTQTVAPADLAVGEVTADTVELTWTPTGYTWGPGGYRVLGALQPGGPYQVLAETENAEVAAVTVAGLEPGTTYFLAVRTANAPHENNQSWVVSDPTRVVRATTVSASGCSVTCSAEVPTSAEVGASVPFVGTASATNCSGAITYGWLFGDGTNSTEQSPSHSYGELGVYTWWFRASVDDATCTRRGEISVVGAGAECGNASCEVGETAWSCPADCGLGPEETGRVGSSTTRLAVPAAVGGQGGVGGTYWVSEAMVHNPGSEPAEVGFHFVADDQPGVILDAGPVTLPAGGAVFYANFVQELFGVSSNGSLRVDADQPVMLVSRTFNDQPQGTYGQFLGGVPLSRAVGFGDVAYLIALSEDSRFRSNLILQEVAGLDTSAVVRLFDGDGGSLGEADVSVPALSKVQSRLSSLGFSDLSGAYATVEVTGGGQLVAIASVVDQTTGDAMTVDALDPTQAQLTHLRQGRAAEPRPKTLQEVDFSWSPETPLVGETVQFTDLSSSDILSWSWRFGDGSSSNERNPTHAFATAGTYGVTLVVASSSFGSAFHTENLTVLEAATTPAQHYLLAVVARQSGAEGTVWRSDLWVMNPLEGAQQVWLEYHPVDGGAVARTEVLVRAGAQLTVEDVVDTLFASSGEGKGALHVFAPEGVFVTSRTYNLGTAGTYGQAMPALAAGDLLAPGDSGRLLKLKGTSTMRCNVGFTEMDGLETSVRLELLQLADGVVSTLAERTFDLGPYENLQVNRVFSTLGLSGAYEQALAVVEVESGGHVYAYASNVDESTGDGEFIPAMRR